MRPSQQGPAFLRDRALGDEERSRDRNERFAVDPVGRSVQNSYLACGIGEPECGRKRLAAEEPTRRSRKLSGPGVEPRASAITSKRVGCDCQACQPARSKLELGACLDRAGTERGLDED